MNSRLGMERSREAEEKEHLGHRVVRTFVWLMTSIEYA